MKTYLFINAALYALLALACTLRHRTTSAASGFVELDRSGHSEYLVIYGGLQWGVAAIFFWLGTHPEYHRAGLFASLLLYAPIVLYRVVTGVLYRPVSTVTLSIMAVETALLLTAVWLWFSPRSASTA